MDYSPPGSSIHGDSPGKNTGVGCHTLLQDLLNPGLPHCRQILYCLSHQGSPFTILVAVKSIHSSWEEVKISTLRQVWNKLIPALMVDFGVGGGVQDFRGGSNSRYGGNSKRTRSELWRCDCIATITWSNFNGWRIASYEWAKIVISWNGNYSWLRCYEDYWNDSKEFWILHKLLIKQWQGLRGLSPILKEVLL